MQPKEAAVMQRRKTHFEQVPIEVAEKVLRQATVLAIARQSLRPLPVRERETAAEVTERPGKDARKEQI
jgi:hypothetical protein